MATIRPLPRDSRTRDHAITAGMFVMCLGLGLGPALAGGGRPPSTQYYSTAEPPRDYQGPLPTWLAMGDLEPSGLPEEPAREGPKAAPAPALTAPEETPQVASNTGAAPKPPDTTRAPSRPSVASASDPTPTPHPAPEHPVVQAKKAILACQERYRSVRDYTCTFVKRERIDGRLYPAHVMNMKARSQPFSIYFKFQTPNKGREAIYVAGRHGGKILAHDVGFGKVLAGTLKLDPKGSMAMEENRHPVTEAGIGGLIDTVAKHWAVELTPEESVIRFQNMQIDGRPCTMIESNHPRRHPGFMYYSVKLYIDQQHGLPVRFEAYDWPKHPGGTPELVEEYTYLKLQTNVGLQERDFDANNPQYAFGRF